MTQNRSPLFYGLAVFYTLACLFAAAMPAKAQAPPVTVTATVAPDTPFQIQWDHDTLMTPGFRWWCDGGIVYNFKHADLQWANDPKGPNADGTFTYTATVPGLHAGDHACTVSAFNEAAPSLGDFKGFIANVHVALTTDPPAGQKLPSMPLRIKLVVPVSGGGHE